ncbi:MAG: bifunctional acetate--CoA ligase family protein/GNAT family N-acetyltransferase [Bacteroidales bacterium]|nr:bifunctional acetate--CoA ligase family protein/GNAT family N-acetyltransferase [Bacteroidales bacterium]
MGIRKLNSIFKPQRIALIGVPADPNTVGGLTLRNLVGGGFRGVVYPVNPKHEAVLGIPCYPNVKSLPKTPDLAVITTNARVVPQIVEECGEAGIKGVIIMSAGFKEVGAEGRELENKVKQIVKKYEMRVIGPNCLGIIIPGQKLNISFANSMPLAGNVAFISQSGALCTSVLDWANTEKIGFSYFVSIGNTMDIGFGDLIDYFGQDPNTRSIVLYVESITFAQEFVTAARAFARKKPIIVYKAGRFPESAQAAASHTGAMASEDAIYDALFRRAGIARVYNIGNIFDFTDFIGRKRIPKGPNLAIVTNAGGPGVMATDSLMIRGGKLGKLTDETLKKLDEVLPPYWSHGNPVDVLGDAPPARIAKATEIVMNDANVDAVLVIATPQAMTQPTETAREIIRLSESTSKPIMANWLGGQSMYEAMALFNSSGVAAYQTPEQAVRAFMTMVDYSRNMEALFETPKEVPLFFNYDRQTLREKFVNQIFPKQKVLSVADAKALINAYGIKSTKPVLVNSPEEAVKVANKIGYPVVLKIDSPEVTHKSDIGGVVLDLENDHILKAAYLSMMERVKIRRPGIKINGVTVQKMIDTEDAVEMILGIKKDAVFGTLILIGMGGTEAELYKDQRLEFPPLNERLANQMIESLKIYPLLKGYRGRPPKNINKLVEVMIRLSYLAADYPEIEELDINPIIVTADDVVALDARVVIDEETLKNPVPQYSHLILRPYPERYIKKVTLADGTPTLLRPIKPEDEPMWLELLGSCSKEAIYSRFRYNFHFDSHEIATQFCYIDYARELAIVAEIEQQGRRKLIGVGRLIGDPDLETVEYAILVTDNWQGKDLGKILTEYCTEIAHINNFKRIFAETTKDNKAMISVFKKQGFHIEYDSVTNVSVHKELQKTAN